MASSRSKTRYLAQLAIEQFIERNIGHCYFLTFTEPPISENHPALWTKDEAEKKIKPFRDWCSRKGMGLIIIWQKQKRGSWHPHCLVDHYVDVNWCRPWMVARGWGQQMKFLSVFYKRGVGGGAWTVYEGASKLVPYLTRLVGYVTRDIGEGDKHKKVFSCQHDAKVGTVTHDGKRSWCWDKYEHAGSFLYAMGRPLFYELYERQPEFRDIDHIIRLGVEVASWQDVDPLWEFAFSSG
jgi:hypothetical protein